MHSCKKMWSVIAAGGSLRVSAQTAVTALYKNTHILMNRDICHHYITTVTQHQSACPLQGQGCIYMYINVHFRSPKHSCSLFINTFYVGVRAIRLCVLEYSVGVHTCAIKCSCAVLAHVYVRCKSCWGTGEFRYCAVEQKNVITCNVLRAHKNVLRARREGGLLHGQAQGLMVS